MTELRGGCPDCGAEDTELVYTEWFGCWKLLCEECFEEIIERL